MPWIYVYYLNYFVMPILQRVSSIAKGNWSYILKVMSVWCLCTFGLKYTYIADWVYY